MKSSRPNNLTLKGAEIESLEAATGDSVRITLKDGSFILISPGNRDVHRPDEDLLIEVLPETVERVAGHDDGHAELLDLLWLEHSYAHPGKTECTKCRKESELRVRLGNLGGRR